MGVGGALGGQGRGYSLLSMNLPMCFWKLVLGRGTGTAGTGDGAGRGEGRGGVAGRKSGGAQSPLPRAGDKGYEKGSGKGSSSARVATTAAGAGAASSGTGDTLTTTGAATAVVDLDDVAGLDATLYKSLLHVRDNEGVDDLCLTFEAPVEELVLQSTTTTTTTANTNTNTAARAVGAGAATHQDKGHPFAPAGTAAAFSFSGVMRKSDEGVRRCSSSSSSSSSGGTSGSGSSIWFTSCSSSPLALDLEARVVGVSTSRCVPLVPKGGSATRPPLHATADAAVAVTDANKESYLAAVVNHMTTKRFAAQAAATREGILQVLTCPSTHFHTAY